MQRNTLFNTCLNIVLFLLLELLAITMLKKNSIQKSSWLSGISITFYANIRGTSEKIKNYLYLSKENRLLAEENFALYKEVQKLKHLIAEKELSLNLNDTTEHLTYIGAEIVKISKNKQHNYIILNKGKKDGVEVDCGVVTNKGVVGIVTAVSKNYSFVLSFMNTNFNLSSIIGIKGPVGRLFWSGLQSNTAILKDIPIQYDVMPNDTIYTSGYSTIFPPKIALGITGDSKIVNGSTKEIDIKLFEDFKLLRFVKIIKNHHKEEISYIEQANYHN